MHALRDSVLIPFVQDTFQGDGPPKSPALGAALTITLDDLSWWAKVLGPARATQLPPGNFRLRAALNQPLPRPATPPKA